MVRAVNLRPLTAKVRVQGPTLFYITFVVNKMGMGQVFFQLLRFSPVSNIPPVIHNHLQLHVAHKKDKEANPENLFKKKKEGVLSKIGTQAMSLFLNLEESVLKNLEALNL